MKIEQLDEEDIRALIDDDLVHAHRARGLSPEHPFIRGTAQNPDVYFQRRRDGQPVLYALPEIIQTTMDEFAVAHGTFLSLV